MTQPYDEHPLPTLNTLWLGSELGELEVACLESAVRVGHRLRVFSYETLQRVPEGAEVRDASEVAHFDLVREYVTRGSYTVAANLWRYALLEKGLGVWIDTDVYVLRPIPLLATYLFGWEDTKSINNAVLYLPPNSELLRRLSAFAVETGDARWAQERDVFYPIPWQLTGAIYLPVDWRRFCSEQTRAIHLWRHLLPESAVHDPPKGSLLHEILECHRQGGVLGSGGDAL
jgi:hypothetical protein